MHSTRRIFHSPWSVFGACWILLFLLYLPAGKAGWVSDTLGWLDAVRGQSFGNFVNRSGMGVHTFYQTTQVITWLLYRVLGANEWAWHLVHISLQALNATLLCLLIRQVFRDFGLKYGSTVGWTAALLFCSSPHLSEVVVWEASFHFLQGLFFQLLLLLLMARSLHRLQIAEWVAAIAIMLAAAGSLEVFYLTPAIMAFVIAFYRFALRWEWRRLRKVILYFLLPQAGIVVLHLLLSGMVFGTATARLGDAPLHQSLSAYAIKPPMLFFHLLGGRFLPQAVRDAVYSAFCTYSGAGIFYASLCAIMIFMVRSFLKKGRLASVSSLAFFWMLFAIAFASLLWLPTRLLILGDRYLYVILPPFYLLIATGVIRLRTNGLRLAVTGCVVALQCAATLHLSELWQRSDTLDRTIVRNFSVSDTGKIILMLNNPHSLHGALMVGAGRTGELMEMRRLFYGDSISAKIYEVAAIDLEEEPIRPGFEWINDSTIIAGASLRWWRRSDYLQDYVTPDYELRVSKNGHSYTLHLKGNAQCFAPMYVVGRNWYALELEKPPDHRKAF